MQAAMLSSFANEYGSLSTSILSANVKRLLVLLKIVLEVTLVKESETLNRYWAMNHSMKHCQAARGCQQVSRQHDDCEACRWVGTPGHQHSAATDNWSSDGWP